MFRNVSGCSMFRVLSTPARSSLWASDNTFFRTVVSEGIRRDKRRGENLILRL